MSVKHQIQKTIFQNVVDQMSEKHIQENNIPKTRDEAKKWGKEERYIYSYTTAKKVMQTMNRVAKHSGITDINQLKQKHANAYIKSKIDQGCSKNYLVTERYGIRKFEKCMISTGRKSKYTDSFSPDVKLPEGSRINPIGRYSAKEAKIINESIESKYKKEISLGIKLQEVAGLRISELTGLRAKYVDLKGRQIFIKDNIAKGGRARVVSVNKEDMKVVRAIVEGKDPDEKLISVTGRWIEKVVEKICDQNDIKNRSTHGMRGKFANDRLQQYCKQYGVKYDIDRFIDVSIEELTGKEKHVLRLVSNDLGHNRISVIRKHYLHR